MSDSAASVPDVEVRRGSPTPEELAALVAVVTDAYRTEPAASTAASPARSGWDVAARGLRQPLQRERGWGGFSG